MFLDNETDIINLIFEHVHSSNVLLYSGNSFSKKILNYIKKIGTFTENNSHSALPPDFYSDEFSCMFDVMRINDSEIKKSYNPVKIRERQLEKEIKKSGILDMVSPNPTIFIISEGRDDEHSFKNYKKQCNRVMSEHIKKISIWKNEHPDIKYKGLLIFDETNCYFEGCVIDVYVDLCAFLWDASKPIVYHKPWMDAAFIENAYKSDLDFVIWFCPYKPYGNLLQQTHYHYPKLVILDTRFPRYDFMQYCENKLQRM